MSLPRPDPSVEPARRERPSGRTPSPPLVAVLAISGVLLLSALAVGSLVAGGAATGASAPQSSATLAPIGVAVRPSAESEQVLQPVSADHPLSWSTPAGIRFAPTPRAAWLNSSQCDPYWPTSMPIGFAPINASVVWTGNTTGPAPLNVSWAVAIGGGGIPPYQVVVEFENWVEGAIQANSTSPNGSISLTTPGMYIGVAEVVDSTCDAVAASYLGPITVYPSSGVDPVQISASVSGGPAPLTVEYTENASLAGPDESMVWTTPVSWESSGWSVNATYYRAGNFTAVGCLVNVSTAVYFACGTSGPVAVTGTLIQTSVAIGNGSLPVPIAFFVNLTNGSAFPSNWSVDLWTDNGTLHGTTTQNASSSVTALFGCGPTYVTDPPNAAGVCTWTASYLITATPGGSAEFVTEGTLWANLTENGSPVQWYPTVSYTESPTNGTAPLNVTVNLTASNGLAPYQYWWAIFGTSSAAANRTFYPTVSGNASGWNGTNLSLAFPLTRDGIYFVALTVVDSELNPVFLYPAVVTVGVALAPVPLGVVASENGVSTAGPNSSVVQFVANVSGGAGPYTLQWAFGDGTYGSSIPGVAVVHTYRGAGTYPPTVTVTDRLGATDTTALPAVTVRAASDSGGGNHSARGVTNPPAGGGSGAPGLSFTGAGSAGVDVAALAIAVAALVLVGLAVYRTEQLRAAERFVRTLDADSDRFRRGPPPGA